MRSLEFIYHIYMILDRVGRIPHSPAEEISILPQNTIRVVRIDPEIIRINQKVSDLSTGIPNQSRTVM